MIQSSIEVQNGYLQEGGGKMKNQRVPKKDLATVREESKKRQKLLRDQMRELFKELASIIRPPLDSQQESTKKILIHTIAYIKEINQQIDSQNAGLLGDHYQGSPVPISPSNTSESSSSESVSSVSLEQPLGIHTLEQVFYADSKLPPVQQSNVVTTPPTPESNEFTQSVYQPVYHYPFPPPQTFPFPSHDFQPSPLFANTFDFGANNDIPRDSEESYEASRDVPSSEISDKPVNFLSSQQGSTPESANLIQTSGKPGSSQSAGMFPYGNTYQIPPHMSYNAPSQAQNPSNVAPSNVSNLRASTDAAPMPNAVGGKSDDDALVEQQQRELDRYKLKIQLEKDELAHRQKLTASFEETEERESFARKSLERIPTSPLEVKNKVKKMKAKTGRIASLSLRGSKDSVKAMLNRDEKQEESKDNSQFGEEYCGEEQIAKEGNEVCNDDEEESSEDSGSSDQGLSEAFNSLDVQNGKNNSNKHTTNGISTQIEEEEVLDAIISLDDERSS